MTHAMHRSIAAMSLLLMAAVPAAGQEGSPAGAVPLERLQARRAALLQRLGTGVAVVRSGTERSIEGDYPQDSDYRERNDFFYLTGIEAPDAWLVLVAEDSAPDRALLFLEPRDSASEQWTGVKLGAAEARRLTGVDSVSSADSAEAGIRRLVLRPGSPARRGALYVARDPDAADSDFLRRLVFSAAPGGGGLPVRDVATELAALRLVKDADEVARLRRAIDITAEAQRRAMSMVRPGVWEYEIEAEIEGTFRRRGAERVGFPTIVGSGPNSTTLHYDKNRRQTRAGDLVVADIGAEWGYYSADVTRTLPVSGKFTPRQRALYDLVLATQQAGIDSVRPGVTVGDLNRIARTYMREHSGTLCGEVTCDRYFIHGLSHWLGMDVHDVGSYTSPLAPGMVVTVEPGLYIPEENIGIRIEDDVLVTMGAPEVLSAAAPRRAAEIEALMARR
jgi:Xaa-Pro aminopeptidase